MNKLFFSLLFLILFAPGILSMGIKLVPDGFQPSLGNTIKIFGTTTATQPLTAVEDNFSGIGVSIKNPNLSNKKDINLSLYQGDILVREVVLNGKSIADGNFVKFIFDPIEGSKGQNYDAVFSAVTADNGESLEIFLTQNAPRQPVIAGKEKRVDALSEVTFYRPSSSISLMIDIYKEWLRKFTADTTFFIFYCTILALGLGYLLLETFQRRKVN